MIDSHIIRATHSGILTSVNPQPLSLLLLRITQRSLPMHLRLPKLLVQVLAPLNFLRAESLDQ